MNEDRRFIRWCAYLIAAAIAFRLCGSAALRLIPTLLERPGTVAAIMYLETGRVLKASVTEPAPAKTAETLPEISYDEGEAVEVSFFCDLRPDFGALAEMPLRWNLTGEAPTVLIFHSHAMESYEKNGEDYEESSPYRTADTDYNMVSIGDYIARILEENGIRVIHDRTLHDESSYENAYDDARESVEQYLEEYPEISLILDLHRDAAERDGQQIVTTCMAGSEEAAKLMFVMGTDAYFSHPYWEESLAIAVKLQAIIAREYPDMCRPLQLSASRFNQELHPGFLLVEVGTAGNTLAQAKQAAGVLAEAIVTLAHGTKEAGAD